MQQHRVYFIGAGPGDPDMLTLGGARALELCQEVFVAPPYEVTFANLLAGKSLHVPFEFYFDEMLALINNSLTHTNVAFLVPGDLTFYSPFQALVDALGEQAVVIPGVGTANVASAFLKKTLDLPGVSSRAIIASPRTLGDDGSVSIRTLAAPGVTLLIYMNNIPLPQLVDDLKAGYGENVPIAILHRLCLPQQEVVTGRLDDIIVKVGQRDFFNLESQDKRPALTLIIVGETLSATADGKWWDYRRDTIWRYRKTEQE